ncbi:CoA synthetase (ADP-forming) beta subunit / acetyl-CoA synthetase (ADP-forming) beta subunit [mine drainage metagenome]|uniref:CoA synthetase (ADP-forming) beta subunit / acetyl-CoA synthetase (ADP-forming) beta subunit n=1 Tax=mine drainage metagenome TaxID=410659 RepID=T1ATH4_9ZZZZ
MLPQGVEFIIGVVRDSTFGHVIMLGAGGVYTELYHDVAFRKIPISQADASEMLEEIKSSRFCTGFRGIKVNCAALKQLLVSVSNLVSQGKHGIETMDLNPVIVTSEDALVADAKMSVKTGRSE